jgi:hypothetical protein
MCFYNLLKLSNIHLSSVIQQSTLSGVLTYLNTTKFYQSVKIFTVACKQPFLLCYITKGENEKEISKKGLEKCYNIV